MPRGREIWLFEDHSGWSAIDRDAGVASQGDTPQEALEKLDDIVELTIGGRADGKPGAAQPPPDVP